MKRRTFLQNSLWATAGFALSNSFIPGYEKNELSPKSAETLITSEEGLNIIVLEGPPKRRGQIHGESLRSKISEIVSIWKEELHKANEMNPDAYIEEFVQNTNFIKAIEKWTPDLLEEVRGIAEGSGIDFKTMYAFQLVDEEWWYSRNRKLGIIIPESKHCSALGVYGQEGIPPIVAQNLDIPGFVDGYQVILHVKHQDSSLESFIFSYAGLIAANGINNHSLGICCNALLELNQRKDGLPVAFIHRGVLSQKNYEDAVRFIQTINHASGQNYILGGPGEVSSWECSANKVVRFWPYEGAKRLYHTNHALVNDDQSIYQEILKKLPQEKKPQSPGNSLKKRSHNLLETLRFGMKRLKNALRTHKK